MTTFTYRRYRLLALFVILMICLSSGCTRQRSHVPVHGEEIHAADPFANHVGTLEAGSYKGQNLTTPFGPSSFVRVGQEYLSGLGLICKRVTIDTATGSHRSAACKQSNGWFLADPIFEPSAL